MNKSDITIVALLVALLLAWGYWSRIHAPPPGKQNVSAELSTNLPPVTLPQNTALQAVREPPPVSAVQAAIPAEQEETLVLSNANVRLTLSSLNGGIVSAKLLNYRAACATNSPPVDLDFRSLPALSLRGTLFPTNGGYRLLAGKTGNTAMITAVLPNGLLLQRSLSMDDTYRLTITDVFTNNSPSAVKLPAYGLAAGPMEVSDPTTRQADLAFLGIDTLATHGGESVRYWMTGGFFSKSPLPPLFEAQSKNSTQMPLSVEYTSDDPVLWAAVKSKFFVQILYGGELTTGCSLIAWRKNEPSKSAIITAVSATVLFPAALVNAGAAEVREASYYLGPKKYTLLKALGSRQDEVMDLGKWFGWICKMMLPVLNGIHAVLPNYGIAVILLTVLVRLILWPLTVKSTKSMKKMQELQPLVTQLREKLKDKPQKMNQELMALYKEHKVNPMAGCLPMLLQLPVFIALFTVLQSAVELRFASFLWIRDLSEPEGLLAGMLPFSLSLNILPLFMTGLTVWQQKITPSGGDPQQQKMMMFMPVIFLFLFYNMASALVLYWTVSQAISIAQMVYQKNEKPTILPGKVAGKR